jgi:hypothetical protein
VTGAIGDRFEHGNPGRRDFGADAVARQYDDLRLHAASRASNVAMSLSCCNRNPSWSTPLNRQCRAKGSNSNVKRPPSGSSMKPCATSIASSIPGCSRIAVLAFAQHDREQSVFRRVAAEDVGDLARQHGADAVVEQRPERMLARRSAAKLRSAARISQPCAGGLFRAKSGSDCRRLGGASH